MAKNMMPVTENFISYWWLMDVFIKPNVLTCNS